MKESLREDITSSIEEKIAPLRKEIDVLKTVIYNLRRQLGELEQYDRIPLIRFSGVPKTDGEDTNSKILEAATTAGITLQPGDIVNNPDNYSKGPRQIIARLQIGGHKIPYSKKRNKIQETEKTKRISVNEELTKYRDRLCRQLCREQKLFLKMREQQMAKSRSTIVRTRFTISAMSATLPNLVMLSRTRKN